MRRGTATLAVVTVLLAMASPVAQAQTGHPNARH